MRYKNAELFDSLKQLLVTYKLSVPEMALQLSYSKSHIYRVLAEMVQLNYITLEQAPPCIQRKLRFPEETERGKTCLRKYGFIPNDTAQQYKAEVALGWLKVWRQKARIDGIPFGLRVVDIFPLPENKKGQMYTLHRINESRGYTSDNVYITVGHQTMSEVETQQPEQTERKPMPTMDDERRQKLLADWE